jgi:hypothetical protein
MSRPSQTARRQDRRDPDAAWTVPAAILLLGIVAWAVYPLLGPGSPTRSTRALRSIIHTMVMEGSPEERGFSVSAKLPGQRPAGAIQRLWPPLPGGGRPVAR